MTSHFRSVGFALSPPSRSPSRALIPRCVRHGDDEGDRRSRARVPRFERSGRGDRIVAFRDTCAPRKTFNQCAASAHRRRPWRAIVVQILDDHYSIVQRTDGRPRRTRCRREGPLKKRFAVCDRLLEPRAPENHIPPSMPPSIFMSIPISWGAPFIAPPPPGSPASAASASVRHLVRCGWRGGQGSPVAASPASARAQSFSQPESVSVMAASGGSLGESFWRSFIVEVLLGERVVARG